MTVRTRVREYVLENFLFTDDPSALDDDTSFLEAGFIDSTGIMELILFLEDEFEIKVKDDEMKPENLDSITALVGFVDRSKPA